MREAEAKTMISIHVQIHLIMTDSRVCTAKRISLRASIARGNTNTLIFSLALLVNKGYLALLPRLYTDTV